MEKIQSYSSHIDKDFQVLIVYPESILYNEIKPQFEISGHAFLIHERKMIIIDGSVVEEEWFTKDHLLVIEAHEVGHYIAEHSVCVHGKTLIEMEREADWAGYQILKSTGRKSAASLHRDEFKERYGTFPRKEKRYSKIFDKIKNKFAN